MQVILSFQGVKPDFNFGAGDKAKRRQTLKSRKRAGETGPLVMRRTCVADRIIPLATISPPYVIVQQEVRDWSGGVWSVSVNKTDDQSRFDGLDIVAVRAERHGRIGMRRTTRVCYPLPNSPTVSITDLIKQARITVSDFTHGLRTVEKLTLPSGAAPQGRENEELLARVLYALGIK